MRQTPNRNLIVIIGVAIPALMCCAGIAAAVILAAGSAFSASTACLNPSAGETVYFPGEFALSSPVEGSMAIPIPASARSFGSECESWLDVIMYLWFDMDAAELDTFIEQAQIDTPLIDAPYPPSFGPSPRDPESVTYLYGSRPGPCGQTQCHMTIWIDTTEPETYRVYIFFGYGG